MENLYTDRLNSFKKSLEGLKEAKNRDRTDDFVISGTVQKFSLTFDLAWKLMKDILVQKYNVLDFALGSPSEVLKKAFENDLIDDDIWMTMLKDRNNLIHDYDEILAETAVNSIIDKYIEEFKKFEKRVLTI
jgi:nucleotidyltransferase substrate binding protein (TIGR01987 family)